MPYDESNTYQNSVSATLGSGPLNNVAYATFVAASAVGSYRSGSTNRLILTPASGGTTINGLDASGVTDGFTLLIVNGSATDILIFAHLASGSLSGNQFSNQGASSVQIPALGAARCTYVVNKWQFA